MITSISNLLLKNLGFKADLFTLQNKLGTKELHTSQV